VEISDSGTTILHDVVEVDHLRRSIGKTVITATNVIKTTVRKMTADMEAYERTTFNATNVIKTTVDKMVIDRTTISAAVDIVDKTIINATNVKAKNVKVLMIVARPQAKERNQR